MQPQRRLTGLDGAAIATPVSAAFSQTQNGLTVNFTDTSVGSPTAWSWNFGDGNTSISQNPSHTYAADGTYTVSLSVSKTDDTDLASASVTVAAPTIAYTLTQIDFDAATYGGINPEIQSLGGDTTGSAGRKVNVFSNQSTFMTHREFGRYLHNTGGAIRPATDLNYRLDGTVPPLLSGRALINEWAIWNAEDNGGLKGHYRHEFGFRTLTGAKTPNDNYRTSDPPRADFDVTTKSGDVRFMAYAYGLPANHDTIYGGFAGPTGGLDHPHFALGNMQLKFDFVGGSPSMTMKLKGDGFVLTYNAADTLPNDYLDIRVQPGSYHVFLFGWRGTEPSTDGTGWFTFWHKYGNQANFTQYVLHENIGFREQNAYNGDYRVGGPRFFFYPSVRLSDQDKLAIFQGATWQGNAPTSSLGQTIPAGFGSAGQTVDGFSNDKLISVMSDLTFLDIDNPSTFTTADIPAIVSSFEGLYPASDATIPALL